MVKRRRAGGGSVEGGVDERVDGIPWEWRMRSGKSRGRRETRREGVDEELRTFGKVGGWETLRAGSEVSGEGAMGQGSPCRKVRRPDEIGI